MISVIAQAYKAEKYFHRYIDSILAQSYTDYELLLIDEGGHFGGLSDTFDRIT